jgi:hypothetical protein
MTEPLRALLSPADLHDAIAEAVEKHPHDPDEAVRWLLRTFAMPPELAESLAMDGRRELGQVH